MGRWTGRMRRWWIKRVAASVVLGWVTAIGVAWLLAGLARIDPLDGEQFIWKRPQGLWVALQNQRMGSIRTEWAWQPWTVDWPTGQSTGTTTGAAQFWREMIDRNLALASEQVGQAWRPAWPSLDRLAGDIEEVVIDARGWPMPCAYCVWTHPWRLTAKPGATWTLRGGIALPDRTGERRPEVGLRALPCIPLLMGVALDSALFALPWLAVITVMPIARWWWRWTLCYCPACRYDLGEAFDLGCPECGWNRPNAKGVEANS